MIQTGHPEPAAESIRQAIAIDPGIASFHANLGIALQQQGKPTEAIACFYRAIALRPNDPDVYNNLGNALHTLGRLDEAEDCFHRALALRPIFAEAHNNLGNTLAALGRLNEAEDSFHRALGLWPTYPEAHNNLGDALRRLGRLDDAAASFRHAIELRPGYWEALGNLGDVLRRQGQLDDAAARFRQLLQSRPNDPYALNSLGATAHEQGRLAEAAACFTRLLLLRPTDPEPRYNLGNVFRQLGRPADAATCYREAIALRPDFALAHNNLGQVEQQLGRPAAAVESFREAARLRPNDPEPSYNLGTALLHQWRLNEAADCLRHAIALRPEFPDAYHNLGNTLKEQGRLHEAIACYQQALRISPDFLLAYSSLLFVKNYLEKEPATSLRELARGFGMRASARVDQAFAQWRETRPEQPLLVGLVSGDLGNHPVGYFLEGLLREADPARIAFAAFPTQPAEDELTARIKPYFHSWQPIHGLPDAAAAELIHAAGVQVLLDLSGHTANNRLPVFAWRPAPVQASWLGYFATTGVAEIDYVIGDPQVAPPEEADHFIEAIWPLPETYFCFTPPAHDIAVSALPAGSTGTMTFGCCNNLAKLNDAVVELWARVLHAVPASRLLLRAFQLQDPDVREATRARFAAHGIGDDRLVMEPPSSRADYLRTWHRIDIALDPFPWPGGTTSAEALWMGVPVLTRRGDRFLSHAGETIARTAGLADWIAEGDDAYVAKAVRFGADREGLAGLRAGLREQVLASPLFDARRFARHFEAALWEMWRRRDVH